MSRRIGQTGGADRHWLFDPLDAPEPIAEKLISFDEHASDLSYESMLAIVMDRLLEELPPEQEEAVRLLHLAGLSQHKAAAIIGVTHKTVKARADKGLRALRARMRDSVWLAEMLRGQVPEDTAPAKVTGERVATVLSGLRDRRAGSR